jgi:NADH-quinone oxidoreductase subunit L
MVVPLIILAVPTILAGLLLGLPPEGGAIHTWLEDVFRGAEELGAGILPGSIAAGGHAGFSFLGIGGLLLLLGAVAGTAGIWLAYRWYVRDPAAPARFVAAIPFGLGPGMYAASVNKYYVDDLYGLVWARGGVLVGNLLWWFDAKVIDGAVNGAGWIAGRLGGTLRRSQTGRVQNYGLGMAAGLVVVLVAYLVFRA